MWRLSEGPHWQVRGDHRREGRADTTGTHPLDDQKSANAQMVQLRQLQSWTQVDVIAVDCCPLLGFIAGPSSYWNRKSPPAFASATTPSHFFRISSSSFGSRGSPCAARNALANSMKLATLG